MFTCRILQIFTSDVYDLRHGRETFKNGRPALTTFAYQSGQKVTMMALSRGASVWICQFCREAKTLLVHLFKSRPVPITTSLPALTCDGPLSELDVD